MEDDVCSGGEIIDEIDIQDRPEDELEVISAGKVGDVFVLSCREVVESEHSMAPLQEPFRQVGANESGTTSNEHVHSDPLRRLPILESDEESLVEPTPDRPPQQTVLRLPRSILRMSTLKATLGGHPLAAVIQILDGTPRSCDNQDERTTKDQTRDQAAVSGSRSYLAQTASIPRGSR